MDAEPKTDLSGLRGIAIDRRKQLDPEKVERHFEAGGQGAEAAYYASVLMQLYGEVVNLRDVRVDGLGLSLPEKSKKSGSTHLASQLDHPRRRHATPS